MVFVIDAVRTPFGSHDSKLKSWHAVDLLAATFTGILERSGLQAEDIDHVIAGCATPIGEQAVNITRNAVLAVGWPESLSAHTVDAQGVSGVLAFHEAVARVRSGMSRVCLVGAVSSTRVPEGASTGVAVGQPFGAMVHDRFVEAGGLRSPGLVAEHLAQRCGIDRQALDAYAEASIERAKHAAKKPYLIELNDGKKVPSIIAVDEIAKTRNISSLKPLFEKDGLLTAATFALPVNGAVALLVASADVLNEQTHSLAQVLSCESMGASGLYGDTGGNVAKQALKSANVKASKLARIEVQEDSAVTPLAFTQEFDADVNPDGGSLTLGDAYGVSGLASLVSLVHQGAGRTIAISAGSNAMSTATVLDLHS